MSKRFGRNKKRAMRERIAILEDGMARHGVITSTLRCQVRAMEIEVDEAKEIAGRMSIIFPVCETFNVGGQGVRRNINRTIKDSSFGVRDVVGVDSIMSHEVKQQCLRVLISKISKDALSMAVHMRVTFGDGMPMGYAISEEAINSMPPRVMAQRCIDELGRIAARDLVKTLDSMSHFS